jgi:formamidopyrimidine-DNA glycosylase
MDSKVVVGVGNIYACESLFRAGINPERKAGSVSKKRYARLTQCIKDILAIHNKCLNILLFFARFSI